LKLRKNNKINIKLLCHLAKVSVSWYYKYRKLKLINNLKENREEKDLELVKNLVLKYNRKHWYRMITMLLKSELQIIMNHKKVLRLMNKYDLLSIIRLGAPWG